MKHLGSSRYPLGDGAIVLVPADRFVVRRVPIDPAADITEQVELAIESFSPLPLAQLYWGCLCAPDHRQALVWVACRRHFTPGETADWAKAAAVLPAVLLLARRAANGQPTMVHHDGMRIQAAFWLDDSPLPGALLTRAAGREEEIVREIRERAGLASVVPAEVRGPIEVHWRRKEGQCEMKAGELSAKFHWSELAESDIRDRGELAGLHQGIRLATLLWRASVAAAALVALAAGLDLARFAGGAGLDRLNARIRAQAPAVAELQSAQSLAQRLVQLSQQRLRFMEMLDVLNERRPPGLLFVRVVSRGAHGLEVSARTSNADEARQLEAALKSAVELSSVTLGNLSTRDGHTDFTLQAEFRDEAFGSDLGMP